MASISAVKISKVYTAYGNGVEILRTLSLSIAKGKLITLTGRSGSGKSTLLAIIGGLEVPSTGEVIYSFDGGKEILALPKSSLLGTLGVVRRRLGIVPQDPIFVDDMSVLENIKMRVGSGASVTIEGLLVATEELGERLQVIEKLSRLPGELSGGERQRLSLVRALAPRPDFLIADEPTASLDLLTSMLVINLLRDTVDLCGAGVLVSTHDERIIAISDEVYVLSEGELNRLH